MEMISKEDLNVIQRQMYNKARDIDVAVFNGLFEEDSKELVLDCLMMYMNRDGGFAHGLHIDNYNTNSSVYQTYEAFRILEMIGYDFACENELYLEIVNKAGNYIFNKSLAKDGLFNPLVITNDKFAHGKKFDYTQNFKEIFGSHPTPAILGYCFRFYKENKVYYKKATKQLDYVMNYLNNNELTSDDIISFSSLLGSLKFKNIFVDYQKVINEKLINAAISNQNFNYLVGLMHCDNIPQELVEKLNLSLDELIKSRAVHGLYEHNMDWNNNIYPEEASASIKWIGAQTVNNIYLLKYYNRIEQ